MSKCIACGTETKPLNEWHSKCGNCGLYASNLQEGAGTGVGGLEQLRRSNFEIILDELSELAEAKPLSILEVGCSQGFFLEAAAARGANVEGIEPESDMAEIARAKGFIVHLGFFPDALPSGRLYDIIIFNDVFEHLPNPKVATSICAERLETGGLLVINLPSSDGVFFKIAKALFRTGIKEPYERMWQKGFPSPHTFYFSADNLEILVGSSRRFERIKSHALPSVSRVGLRERVRATYGGATGTLISAGISAISFVLPFLPQDIHVSYFRRN